ncbi:MAG: hypothetical protein M3Y22_04455 [Pseudomonadota bacterium]|jgi:hypothetical protein|nr:hypothetical protein [Pseudomonadota bacterium]
MRIGFDQRFESGDRESHRSNIGAFYFLTRMNRDRRSMMRNFIIGMAAIGLSSVAIAQTAPQTLPAKPGTNTTPTMPAPTTPLETPTTTDMSAQDTTAAPAPTEAPSADQAKTNAEPTMAPSETPKKSKKKPK